MRSRFEVKKKPRREIGSVSMISPVCGYTEYEMEEV